MRRSSRTPLLLLAILISLALFSSAIHSADRALAQDQKSGGSKGSSEPTKNPDGSTTTTKPDDTYAKGGTKETTVGKDGKTVTREVWRDKNGKPVRARGKDGIRPFEIEWKYDPRGRLAKVLVKYADGSRVSVQKEYKDNEDTEGTTDIGSYTTWGDDVTVVKGDAADNVKKFIESFAPRTVSFAAVPPKEETPKTETPKQEAPEQSAPTQTPASQQGTARTQLVGVVYDRNSRPGEQATMSVTDDPKRYENFPGLGVVASECLKCQPDATGHMSLQGITVSIGDGRQQPANQPFTLQLSQTAGNVPISLSGQGNSAPLAQVNVPLPSLSQREPIATAPSTGSPSDFTTPPVVQNTSLIRGPFSNNGNVPRITVDSQPASIIAASPTTVYFDLPTGISAGPHQLIVQDGARGALFPISMLGIDGSLAQSSLERGQTTTFSVTVHFDPDSVPASVWRHGGGISPELVSPAEIQKAAPGIHVPHAREPGGVLLVISNGSPGVVKINDVVRVLHQQDFRNNQFTTSGGVQSLQSGGFVLNLLAANLFAPIPGREVPGNLSESQKLPQNRMNPQLLATSAPAYDPDDPGNKEVKEGDPLNPTTGDDRDFDENAVPYKIVTENDKKKPCPCPPPTLKKENNGKTYIVCAVSAECKANCGGICRLYYAVRKPDPQKPKEKPKWKGGEATGKKEKDDSSVYTCACSTNK